MMQDMKVTTAEFIKNYGQLADRALSEPVTITKNGRERLVLIAVEEFERLRRRDRRVYRAHQVPDDLIEAIEKTEPTPEADAVDALLNERTTC